MTKFRITISRGMGINPFTGESDDQKDDKEATFDEVNEGVARMAALKWIARSKLLKKYKIIKVEEVSDD